MSTSVTTTSGAQLAFLSYEQMERLAVTVAKSGLFGMKTPEQALSLMALSQAEGIHPMIAVRDYHVFNGKPSLKADTILGRHIASGGTVQWHELSDAKADATFSHPQGGTVRLDWTPERAKTAGLAGKDVWKSYGRAMLRSRLISEGVRTVNAGVFCGFYTPEEIASLDPDVIPATTAAQAVDAASHVVVEQTVVDDWITTISESKDMHSLKTVYQDAWKEARAKKDEKRLKSYELAYQSRKAELETPIAPESADESAPVEDVI
jgi:hypothetical protein